jgi:Na+-transporting methylmalonyl-CoA/oxaloacetate decarboxylase gamma subunit
MPNFNVEIAILISIILGFILAILNVGGIFALILVGFVATYLTKPEYADYKVGALATALLSFIYFVYNFLAPPQLPYQLPSPLVLGLGYAIEGIFTLMVGLVLSLLIYGVMGAIGGYIAGKFFKPEKKAKPPKKKKLKEKIKGKPKRRSLYRT